MITVVILLDAFRWDYHNLKNNVPFLQHLMLSQRSLHGKSKEAFGFQMRVAFFAGLHPETSNICNMFLFSPQTSPFEILKYYPRFLIDKIPNRWQKKVEGKVRRWITQYVRKTTPFKALKYYATPIQIPLPFLKYFDFAEKNLPWEGYGEATSLFPLLQKENLQWVYYGYPLVTDCNSDFDMVEKFKQEVSTECKFAYIHLSQLDGLGHAFGSNSQEVRDGIKNIDSLVEQIWKHCEGTFGLDNTNFVIFADHGMVDITKVVDLWNPLLKTKLKLGKDYIVFLDSPMARFWFFNENARDIITELLIDIGYGKILTEEDYAIHKIRFKHDRYWQLIFLADPGVLIHPNFFQMQGEPIKGMHGYDPNYIDNQGIFLLNSPKVKNNMDIGVVDLVDIFPTVLDLMALPIPETNEGQSVFEKANGMQRSEIERMQTFGDFR